MQQQRILVRRRCASKSQTWCEVKPSACGVDAERLVVRDHASRRRRRASWPLSSSSTPSSAARARMALGDVGGGAQVALRQQVGVDVVVGDRAVLVGAGDAVDPEAPGGVVVAERAPQPSGLDQQLEARRRARSRSSSVGGQVADDGVGDVGVDVKRGRACRPVARALLAADRAPRERGALQAERPRALAGQVERRVAPAQRVGGGARRGVGEHRQHEHLGVPERVPVVAGAGQALGGDRPLLAAGARLQRVEEAEADRLLELGVALELDVGALPEAVQVRALLGQQPLPAGVDGARQRRRRPGRAAPASSARADHP